MAKSTMAEIADAGVEHVTANMSREELIETLKGMQAILSVIPELSNMVLNAAVMANAIGMFREESVPAYEAAIKFIKETGQEFKRLMAERH